MGCVERNNHTDEAYRPRHGDGTRWSTEAFVSSQAQLDS